VRSDHPIAKLDAGCQSVSHGADLISALCIEPSYAVQCLLMLVFSIRTIYASFSYGNETIDEVGRTSEACCCENS